MPDLKIIKKDGSEVKFDKNKIIEACKSAGTSEKIAKTIADEVSKELPKIHSSKVRELVLKKLEDRDQEAAKAWLQFDIREKGKE